METFEKTYYKAIDGKVFDNPDNCRLYEHSLTIKFWDITFNEVDRNDTSHIYYFIVRDETDYKALDKFASNGWIADSIRNSNKKYGVYCRDSYGRGFFNLSERLEDFTSRETKIKELVKINSTQLPTTNTSVTKNSLQSHRFWKR